MTNQTADRLIVPFFILSNFLASIDHSDLVCFSAAGKCHPPRAALRCQDLFSLEGRDGQEEAAVARCEPWENHQQI